MKFHPMSERPTREATVVLFHQSKIFDDVKTFAYTSLNSAWWTVLYSGGPDYVGWCYLDEICKHIKEELGK